MKFYFGENETRVVGTLGISSDNSAVPGKSEEVTMLVFGCVVAGSGAQGEEYVQVE